MKLVPNILLCFPFDHIGKAEGDPDILSSPGFPFPFQEMDGYQCSPVCLTSFSYFKENFILGHLLELKGSIKLLTLTVKILLYHGRSEGFRSE